MTSMGDVYNEVNKLLPDPRTSGDTISPYNIEKAFVLLQENRDRVKNHGKRKYLERFFLTQLTVDNVLKMSDYSKAHDAIGQFAQNNDQKVVIGKDVTFGDLWKKYPWNDKHSESMRVHDWVDYANKVFGGTEATLPDPKDKPVQTDSEDSSTTPGPAPALVFGSDSDGDDSQLMQFAAKTAKEWRNTKGRSGDMTSMAKRLGVGGTSLSSNNGTVQSSSKTPSSVDTIVITSDDEEETTDTIVITSDDEEDKPVQSDNGDREYFPLLKDEKVPFIGKGSIKADRTGTFFQKLKQFASKAMKDTDKECFFGFQECQIASDMVVLPKSADNLSEGLKALKLPSPESNIQNFTWIIIGYQPAKKSETVINFVAWVENFEYDNDLLQKYVNDLRSGVSLKDVLEEAENSGFTDEYLLEKGFTSEDGSQGANLFQFNIFAYEFDVSDSLVNYLRTELRDILQGVNPSFDLVDDDTQYYPNRREDRWEIGTAKYINRVYFSFIKFVIEDAGITEYEFLSGSDSEDDREASERDEAVADVPEDDVELAEYQDNKREASAQAFREFTKKRQGADFLAQVLQLNAATKPNIDVVPVDVRDRKGKYKIELQPLDNRKRLETKIEFNKKLLQKAKTKLMHNVQFVITVVPVLQNMFPQKSLEGVIAYGTRQVDKDIQATDQSELVKMRLKSIEKITNDSEEKGIDVDSGLEERIKTELEEAPDKLEELFEKLFANCDEYKATNTRINGLTKEIGRDDRELALVTGVDPVGKGKRGLATQEGGSKRLKPQPVSEPGLFSDAGPAGNGKRASAPQGGVRKRLKPQLASVSQQRPENAFVRADSGEGDGANSGSDRESDSDLPDVLNGPNGNSANVDFTSTLVGLERLRL